MMTFFTEELAVHRYVKATGLFCYASIAWGTDYSFLNEDVFVKQNILWHFESDYSKVAAAKITTDDVFGTRLHYSEGNGSVYFSHFLNQENALAWQIGANYVDIDWDQNPRFTSNNYIYGITSLSWISNSIDRWRWVVNGGVAVDVRTWDFGKSAVYYTTLWGRYAALKNVGVHIGFYGYYGALNGYVLPILGVDWQITRKWELKAVFPVDASINYRFNPHLTTSLLATSMGGPYRFPRRVHGGVDGFKDGIFKVYSTTVEWNLKFNQKEFFSVGAGGGWDFGGWIQIADSHNRHKKYYNFNGAAYGRVFGTLTF